MMPRRPGPVCPVCKGTGGRVPEHLQEGFGGPYYCFPCHGKGWITPEEAPNAERRAAIRWSLIEEPERQKKKPHGNRTQKKSSSSRSPKSSVAEDLSVLEGMLERGTLTKEEFQIAKREVLGGSHDTPTPAAHRRKTRKGRKAPQLKPGDKVKHPSFGTGVVLKISGSGKKKEITVRFAKHGIKVLAGAFAPLRRST